jgi:tetratricopeptide (TPR) repeat protein
LIFTPDMLNEADDYILFAHVASDLLDSGKLDDAIRICENGLKKVPSYAQGHFILARCYQLKNKMEQAKAEFERVLRYDPNHVAAIREIALFHRRNNMDDLYRQYLYKLLTLDPLNDIVIEESKNADIYHPWIHPDTEIQDAEPEEEKLDLSQFENRDDDFTTIMHGLFKQEDKSEITEDIRAIEQTEEPEEEEIIADELPFESESYNYNLKSHEDLIQSLNNTQHDAEEESEIQIPEPEENHQPPAHTPVSSEPFSGERFEEKEIRMEPESLETEKITEESGIPQDETTIIFEGEISIDPDRAVVKEEKPNQNATETEEDEDQEAFNNNPKLISQTLAEILVSQKKYLEARKMFMVLKERDPENTKYDKKIEFLTRIIDLNQQP